MTRLSIGIIGCGAIAQIQHLPHLRELSDERFREMGRAALERAGFDLSKFSPEYIRAALDTCKGKFRIFSSAQPPARHMLE